MGLLDALWDFFSSGLDQDVKSLIDDSQGAQVSLRILPSGEQDQGSGWLITFSVENLTNRAIAIASTVTATFKTAAGDVDAAFVISGADTTIPAMTKKVFSALASHRNLKPSLPYSLHQVHVTPLAIAE